MKIGQYNQVVRIINSALKYVYKGRCNLNYAAQIIGVDHVELSKYPNDPVWKRIGYYIAQLCVNIFLITSVEKIVIGGGLSHNPHVLKFVEVNFDELINGYVKYPIQEKHSIIVSAMKDEMSELFGAALAFEN